METLTKRELISTIILGNLSQQLNLSPMGKSFTDPLPNNIVETSIKLVDILLEKLNPKSIDESTTNNIKNLKLKQRLDMREYQEPIVADIINNFSLGIPYVLGSCLGSGKTEMAIEAMIRLIESGLVNRVLVLAHSTNVLKENFYERLMNYFEEGETIDIMRGQKNYNYLT